MVMGSNLGGVNLILFLLKKLVWHEYEKVERTLVEGGS